jgi:hypothetical protein
MKCDSRASLLARTFTSFCLVREPKAKVAIINNLLLELDYPLLKDQEIALIAFTFI